MGLKGKSTGGYRGEEKGGSGYNGSDYCMRKLKMLVFGVEDAHGWTYRVEWYFEVQGINRREQLRASALRLEGEALAWYCWSEQREPFTSWTQLKVELLHQFQITREENLHVQFLAIAQVGTVREHWYFL